MLECSKINAANISPLAFLGSKDLLGTALAWITLTHTEHAITAYLGPGWTQTWMMDLANWNWILVWDLTESD